MLEKEYKLFFHTLANNTRLEIIQVLKSGSKTVGELTKALPYDQSTISHSLKLLETCQFVTVKPDGQHRVYSLNKETIGPLLKLIDKHVSKFCKKLCS